MNRAEQAIRREIAKRETELDALREALAMLTSAAGGGRTAGKRRGKRRPKTNAEKAALSKSMRAAWRRRKAHAAAGAKGIKLARKSSAGLAS